MAGEGSPAPLAYLWVWPPLHTDGYYTGLTVHTDDLLIHWSLTGSPWPAWEARPQRIQRRSGKNIRSCLGCELFVSAWVWAPLWCGVHCLILSALDSVPLTRVPRECCWIEGVGKLFSRSQRTLLLYIRFASHAGSSLSHSGVTGRAKQKREIQWGLFCLLYVLSSSLF